MPPMSFLAFSIGILLVFLMLLRYASKLGPFYVYILLIGCLYDYLTEFVGVNFTSVYYYGDFLVRLCTGPLSETAATACDAPNNCIPIAVIFMEACILLAVIRTTDLLAPPRWVKPFLDTLISVNIDVMLDPIASVSRWCGQGAGESFGGLGFWTWLTNNDFPGYWFGVPLFNYIAWYCDTLAFVIAIRLVYHIYIKHRQDLYTALKGALMAVFACLLLEGVINLALTSILNISTTASWQWSVMLVIFGISIALVLSTVRQWRHDSTIEWPLVLTPMFYFGYGLAALLLSSTLSDQQGPLLVVWAVTFVIAASYCLSPFWKTLRS